MDIQLKCFFGRTGGKSKLVKKIIKIIPSHRVYIEPFIGAGSIFFAKPLAEINIINDIDNIPIEIFNDILLTETFDDVNLTLDDITKEKFNEYKTKTEFENPKERLLNNLLLIKMSIMGNTLKYSFTRCNDEIHLRIPKFSQFKKNFNNYKFKLSKTQILNEDYKNVIINNDCENSFIYLDPPYSQMKKCWDYKNYPTRNELFEVLNSIKGKFIMSYDKCDENIELFKENYNIYAVITKYSPIFKNQYKSEIIITNFEVNDEDFIKL